MRDAFAVAFQKAYRVFNQTTNSNARIIQTPPKSEEIKVVMSDVKNTGQASSDNTKNLVRLRYYVTQNDDLIQPDYAADSINLLTNQEMAQIIGQEVDEKGYIETRPRSPIVDDKRLWIIAAVLGPLALIIVLFWLIAFIYYKCINPRKAQVQKVPQQYTPNTVRLHILNFLYS